MQQNNDDKLYQVLLSIEEMLHSQNSFRKNFLRGLLRGLGTAIGATLLFALLTSSIFYFTESSETLQKLISNFINAAI